ncbi:MAG: LuxR family transcriptional regulator [Betaproteobacteria bacterium]
MLRPLKLMPLQFKASGYVPSIVQPLLAAAAKGLDLEPIIRSITKGLGFDNFMYGICIDPQPTAETRQFVYTTLPLEWVRQYDKCDYIEIDPRVRMMADASLPIIWDQKTYRGKSSRLDRFIDDALKHGVASGISLPIRDARRRFAIMALSSAIPFNDDIRLEQINRIFGEIMLFGQYFHELLMTALLDKAVGPVDQGKPLSPRERECLAHVARGLASEDISQRMSITVRTVQMHFDSVRAKLGAANRQEAVALAIKRGIIVV